MIKVIIKKENSYYKNISIKGHAMYDNFGLSVQDSAKHVGKCIVM